MTRHEDMAAGLALDGATLPALLRQHAAERPQAPAIVVAAGPPVTYAVLAARVDALARALARAGLGREARIGVMVAKSADLAATLVATFANAVAVPLDPRLTTAEFEDLRARSRLDALLTDGSGRLLAGPSAHREDLDVHGLRLQLFLTGAPRGTAEACEARADDLAVILRTSGTTALPKLVALTHRNLVSRARRLQRWLGLTAADRALCFAPLHYAHGLETALLAPLAVGGSLACPPAAEPGGPPGDVLAWLADLEPTYYSAGPTFQRMVLDRAEARGGAPRHRLRLIQSGGAPLAARDHATLSSLFGVPVLDAYGLSETGQLASNAWPAGEHRAGTVGRPVEGQVALRGEDGTILEPLPGARGEIVARGADIVTPGYLDDEGRPRPVLVDGWFPTGDLGAIDDDGFLVLSGRSKDIVNRGGEKIAPAEVDQALLRHPEVVEAAAFAVPHPRLGEDLAAAVVLRPGAEAASLHLRRFLAERLVPFKVPRRIHVVSALPKGATGKVSRAALAQQFMPRSEPAQVRSALELEILALWRRLLGRDDIGPTADFFELGGDSLLAVEMRLALEAQIGREVPESLLFEAATARDLANAIVADDLDPDPQLMPLRREGAKAPLFFLDGDLAGGGYYMRRIAAVLDPERPLWLLRPFEPTKGRIPPIEAMAAHYLSLIRQAGFRPPYLFGGHCNGALIALEAARQAEAAGEAVEQVVLVDPISLNARRPLRALVRALRLVARVRSRQERKRQDRVGGAMARVWGFLNRAPWARQGAPAEDAPGAEGDETQAAFDLRHEQRMGLYLQAMASYLPRPVAASLVCLTAARSWPPLSYAAAPWRRFGGALVTAEIPGGHLSCLTHHAEALGQRIDAALAGRSEALRP